MKISFALLGLAVACSAAPAPKKSAPDPGVVEFFYDDQCNAFSKQLNIDPKVGFDEDRLYGGPYGTRSAMFVTTGDLKSWAVLTGDFNNPTVKADKPHIGNCIASDQGVYVRGNNMVTIHTKGH